jgi:hypothetical protein
MKINKSPFSRYLIAGLQTGLAAVGINVVIYLIMIAVGGHSFSVLIIGSIIVASFLPCLLGAVALFLLDRFVPRARLIFTLGVIIVIGASVLPHLGIGPPPSPALGALPEGFDLLTIPLHLVAGLLIVFLLPRRLTQ